MHLLEGVRIALSSLRTHKLRTFLTLLGNIVGTMSVIAVVSLINGIDLYARQEVLSEGSNVFTVSRVNFYEILTDMDAFLESLNNPDLDLEDRDYLAERMEFADMVGAQVETRVDLRSGAKTSNGLPLKGVTPEYAFIEDLPLKVGRHLASNDVQSNRAVVVLGHDPAEDLFPGEDDPTGRTLKIAGRHFRVIGVTQQRGTVLGESRDRMAFIPITTHRKLFGDRESVDIKVAVRDLVDMEVAQDEATFLMRLRHRLRPTEADDFGIVTLDALLNIWSGISKAIYSALVPLVGISLVVGGIVLMNIMLVAVTERTREIGIHKAVGARRSAILWQFLIEAMTLSVVGGILGILIGLMLAGLIAGVSPLPFAFAPWSLWLGLGVTLLIGLIFGTYPAWKAAGLQPVEALRYE